MSNMIDFLERLGHDTQLRYATTAELEEALKCAGIDPSLLGAILGKDQRLLESLLGAATNVCCMIVPAKEDDEEQEGEDDDSDDEDDEHEDDNVKPRLSRVRRVA